MVQFNSMTLSWIADHMMVILPLTFMFGVILIAVLHQVQADRQDRERRALHLQWWHKARSTPFPTGLRAHWLARYPNRSEADFAAAGLALRQYFYLSRLTASATALPSAAADSVWHLMLETPGSYANFCEAAFGRVIPHIEAAHFETPLLPALALTWSLACEQEQVDPVSPIRLPFLFAVDADLAWVGGYAYRAAGTGVELQQPDGTWSSLGWKAWVGGGLALLATGYAWASPPTAKAVETHSGSACGSYIETGSSCGSHHGSSCGSHGSSCGTSCGSSCGGGCGGGGD